MLCTFRLVKILFFAFLMELVTANDQCRTEVSIQGMALKLSVFKRWSLAAPHLCDIKCEQEIRCQSYNYNRKYKICELNNRTKEARPQNFLSAPSWFYIRRLNGRAPLGCIPELPALSCHEIKASEGKDTISGKYWLDPIGTGKATLDYCNMVNEGYIKNSNILSNNESYLAFLREFLVPAVGNDSRWLLCYRASLHGWNAHCPPGARTKDPSGRCCVLPFEYEGRTYHKCAGKVPGNFERPWCSFDAVYNGDWASCDENPYNGYRKTDRAFIYSLHNKEGLAPFKSMVKHDSQAIFMDISHGPTFGGGFDIHIANNAGHNVHSYTNFGHSFLAPSDVEEKDTVLAGTYYFTPDEVEVFYLP
nr:uncharacterized protein LOC131775289 isoform X2 [Pocillopora verrucosa]